MLPKKESPSITTVGSAENVEYRLCPQRNPTPKAFSFSLTIKRFGLRDEMDPLIHHVEG